MTSWEIKPLDSAAMNACRAHWNAVAKPLYSLGLFEEMITAIGGITGTDQVALSHKCVAVVCADNGVVAQGVSQSGQEVTRIVAEDIAQGTSNVNAIATVAGAPVFAYDVGMATLSEVPALKKLRIACGSQDISLGSAMSQEQAERCLQTGIDIVAELKGKGMQIIATGEMGIGNTTTSAAMACALMGRTPEEMTGRGAGLSDSGLVHKREVIQQALKVNQPKAANGLEVLQKVGGFDIGVMAGIFLGGAICRVPIVIDGFISSVAALTAARIEPQCTDFMLASHESGEPAAHMVLEALQKKAVICGRMALGEGTGAAMLFPLLDMALSVYHQSHTFNAIGIKSYEDYGAKRL